MLFMVLNADKPGAGNLREETRLPHVEYLKSMGEKLRLAGPWLAEDNQTAIGSLWIVEAADKVEAEALAQGDPFAQAGLFESCTVFPWRRALGAGIDS
ncbi:MAG: YciI family protein, partial [Alphaproteobacteria bacterium]|nr:YciI family protein [Alphaproteobacteria bacterium]